jgi:hypothetical protein
MTKKDVDQAIDMYSGIVMKKPISKDMKDHLIEGFSVRKIGEDNYELFVIGQNTGHYYTFIHVPLEQWFMDNA